VPYQFRSTCPRTDRGFRIRLRRCRKLAEAIEATALTLVVRQEHEMGATEIAFRAALLGSEGNPPVLKLEHEGSPETGAI
jgi:hypothetical protein